ncbi:hypothetical protein [Pseudomonas nitroreducens]|uniref:Uncharacterized protein n=1 Tax=Pseudomonas nitroreducens TaxID=46680 RepID=A0A6G6IV49_PSENT|nr:hypothetical protein [Pseudomonas nitroreducens]QIE86978.1 hypothetical protein G5B91_12165 [Pseudomonas nitroreducens]
MIEGIEVLLRHWGEQKRKSGLGGALPSTMGTIMEFGGCAPRGGVYGARLLVAGAGPDFVASEVEAALGVVDRADDGAALVLLAVLRYVNHNGLTLAEQIQVLDLGRGTAGRRSYYRRLEHLHHQVAVALAARHARSSGQRKSSRRDGERMRKASLLQAKKAHKARGMELFKGETVDCSSGDMAPISSRQAPMGAVEE